MSKKKSKVITEPIEYKGGTIKPRGASYQAIICRFGKRYTSTLKTVEDAESWIDATEGDLRKFGVSAAILSPVQRRDALDALKLLAEAKKPITLKGVVEAYLASKPTSTRALTINEVHQMLMESKQGKNLRKTSLNNWRKDLTGLLRDFGGRDVASITKPEIEGWVNSCWDNPETRNYRMIKIRALFNYAMHKDVAGLTSNPCAEIEAAKVDSRNTESYTADEAKQILAIALAEYPDLVPAVAIGLFAGIRPQEIMRLDWSKIILNADSGKIEIDGSIAKTREARKITVTPNLCAWLKPYQRKSGLIYESEGRMKAFNRKLRKDLRFIKDGLRHTFGTMHILEHGSAITTAQQMGNSITTLEKHYVKDEIQPEDKAAAGRFWGITPTAHDLKMINAYLNPPKAKLDPITASEFFKKWLTVKARDMEGGGSFAKYRGVADLFLVYLAGAGFAPMHKLPTDCIQAFKAHSLASGKAEGTVKGYEKVLNAAFADAVKWGHVPQKKA